MNTSFKLMFVMRTCTVHMEDPCKIVGQEAKSKLDNLWILQAQRLTLLDEIVFFIEQVQFLKD